MQKQVHRWDHRWCITWAY